MKKKILIVDLVHPQMSEYYKDIEYIPEEVLQGLSEGSQYLCKIVYFWGLEVLCIGSTQGFNGLNIDGVLDRLTVYWSQDI